MHFNEKYGQNQHMLSEYEFKNFQGLPFGLFEFEDLQSNQIFLWPYISMISD